MSLIRPGLAALAKMNPKMAEKAMQRPFYSAVDKAITEITAKQPKGTGDQYLAMILKTKGVKPAEVKDRGIDVALKGKGKTTGADLQKLADENPPTQVKERVLDNNDIDYSDNNDYASINNPTHYGPDQYDDYHTPGGTNYREKLFHLPMPKMEKVKPRTLAELQQEGYTVKDFEYDRVTGQSSYKVIGPDGNWVSQRSGASGVSVPEQALIDYGQRSAESAANVIDKSKIFSSGHFGEEGKQLLAHARVQDMRGPNGEKIMVVDEIQSDWHQQGRKKGYGVKDSTPLTPDEDKELMALYDLPSGRTFDQTARMHALNDRLNASQGKGGIPDAPFKKNWHELIMKRLVDDAVKGGYDRIIFPPGAEQAKRYDLSRQVDKLVWNEEAGTLAAQRSGGDFGTIKYENVTAEKLADYVGEAAAKKLTQAQDWSGWRTIEGEDLRVGGEGMKGFYDKIMPNYIKNQYGVQMGQHPLKLRQFDVVTANGGEGFAVVPKGEGRTVAKYPTMEEAQAAADEMSNVNYHSFDITPEMRESITTQGQPLYQLAPVAGAVGAGMMATEEDPAQYRKGGVVRKPVSMDAMRLATLNKQRKRKYG
jgi:hypothetical protein